MSNDCKCNKGHYDELSDNTNVSCVPCPVGSNCTDGLTGITLSVGGDTLITLNVLETEGGAPAPCSYYSFAKAPNEVLTAAAWSRAP